MENARLITETREALDQQTATAEVLGVINSSPGDLKPVFEAMLEKAHNLCGIAQGSLELYDGERFRAVACRGLSDAFAEILRQGYPASDNPATQPLIEGERYSYIPDVTVADYSVERTAAETEGVRTLLCVPLRRERQLLGMIASARQEIRPFTEKEIALLENFAAQAVIAMENARLITETREALEQQTAVAKVLRVINSSPGNPQPLFDELVETAARLCETNEAGLAIRSGNSYHYVATRSLDPAWETRLSGFSFTPSRETATGRTLLERRIIHIDDLAADTEHSVPEIVTVGGLRTFLGVPLLREKEPLGVLALARQHVERFTDRQIALISAFADQAVIAMENARLITETREALEQQTATAEVLSVINSSPGDLAPVFDAMLERGVQLCDARFGLLGVYDGDGFRGVAAIGFPPEAAEALSRLRHPPPDTTLHRALETKKPAQVADILAEPAFAPVLKANPSLRNARSNLTVPMIKDGKFVGAIIVFREVIRPFSDRETALLQNFADQAVIAIENARLLGEIQQRQTELRVTFDNMADGVAMFDQTLHLAAWNRNFQELIDLPDDLLAERPAFDDYIRYLTERGEFGASDPETEIARLRSRLGDHYSFERTRPDSTVIEVRNNPMPDGGVVVIYSDITERKRSEAEIRAARDAAETAYIELKAAQANLIQAEKMASLGQLTAGIAHEIKNPLNFVNNFASLSNELLEELKEETEPALATLDDDKRAEIDETMVMLSGNLEKIVEHGKRADNIVKSMLEHSRGVSGERREVDLNTLIEDALNLAYHGARAHDQDFNINLERDYAATVKPIELAPQEMTRVFLNLFGNGFYAANKRAHASGDGSFRPILAVATCDDGDAVEVRVRDNGTGIPPEIKDKLFQPFFTTKPTGEGTGLGLSISYDIVTQQHGGTITVQSEPGSFTEFTVRLPRH